jgi:hypothetical protein
MTRRRRRKTKRWNKKAVLHCFTRSEPGSLVIGVPPIKKYAVRNTDVDGAWW